MNNKIPTLEEKVKKYENFLHMINLAQTCMNHDMMLKLIRNADAWSFAARQGNGELSDEEQEKLIAAKFWRLTDTD